MDGPDCPVHHTPMERLSTLNEWVFYCRVCDRRYNTHLEPMPLSDHAAESDAKSGKR